MAETFTSENVRLTTTGATDIYAAPTVSAADRAIVLSCMVANINSLADAEVTVAIADAMGGVLSTLAGSVTIPKRATLEVVANKVILKPGQKIIATAATAGDLDVTCSALEIAA